MFIKRDLWSLHNAHKNNIMFTKKKLPAVNLLFLASSSLKTPPPISFLRHILKWNSIFLKKWLYYILAYLWDLKKKWAYITIRHTFENYKKWAYCEWACSLICRFKFSRQFIKKTKFYSPKILQKTHNIWLFFVNGNICKIKINFCHTANGHIFW